MPPIRHALEGSSSGAAVAGHGRDQKPKALPCKYCNKRFRRVEHVQRHERTHTKEKPFSYAWDRCGKTFRHRHEKLVHLNDGGKDNSRSRRPLLATPSHQPSLSDHHAAPEHRDAAPLTSPAPLHQHQQLQFQRQDPRQSRGQQQQQRRHISQRQQHRHGPPHPIVRSLHAPVDPRCTPRSAACNLDVLSDAAALATEVSSMHAIESEMADPHSGRGQDKTYGEPLGGYVDRGRVDQQHTLSSSFVPQPPQPLYDDYSKLDDLAASPHLVPPPIEPDQHVTAWARSPARPSSQFASRLVLVGPDGQESGDSVCRPMDDLLRAPSFRISAPDHNAIRNRVEEYSAVLPSNFVFPSRHTLTRFLEGYVTGFHEQLLCLHLPTLAPTELAPELLLAMLAVGAQHRFESNRGHALWYAAKAVAMEQIRR